MDTSTSLLDSLKNTEDTNSWAILDSLYGPLIRKWLTRNGVRVDELDDIVQEVLVTVSKKIGDFKHSGRTGAFRAWLKSISINCMRNFVRVRANKNLAVGGTDFERFLNDWQDPHSQVSQLWQVEYKQSVVEYLLGMAKKKFRDNVYRAFHETTIIGKDVDSVSKQLNMSVAAIYTARSRVLRELRNWKEGICEDGL